MPISIRHARVLHDLTQKQVAEELGVSLASYQRFEHDVGKMRVHYFARFAKIFGMEPSDLLLSSDSTLRLHEEAQNDEQH